MTLFYNFLMNFRKILETNNTETQVYFEENLQLTESDLFRFSK